MTSDGSKLMTVQIKSCEHITWNNVGVPLKSPWLGRDNTPFPILITQLTLCKILQLVHYIMPYTFKFWSMSPTRGFFESKYVRSLWPNQTKHLLYLPGMKAQLYVLVGECRQIIMSMPT